jgi:hypothetical protein
LRRWPTRVVARIFAIMLIAMSAAALAAPTPERFDGRTWGQLSGAPPRPAIVVFSTTDCAHCPAVIRKLASGKSRYSADLFAVVMDGGPSIAGKTPYRLADRVFVFDGNEQALRYSVNPDWRGVTPYIALLAPGRPVKYLVGPPAERDLQAFFASRKQ